MNLKKFGLKVLSAAIAVVMLVSVCAPAILAATEYAEENEINYVSIGDSMTNGYGFEGYRQGDYAVGDSFPYGEGIYGEGSYALQFEEWLREQNAGKSINHTKLAVSALRAEDLLFLLGGRDMPTDGWFDEIKHYSGIDDEEELSEIYVNAVKEADIITLCIGNASFGAYMVQYITRAMGVMGGSLDEDEIVTLDMALELLDSEEAKQLVLDIYDKMMEKLVDVIPEAVTDMYELEKIETICDAVAYIAAGFLINYEGVIDQIAALNPDCEIILVGLMNTTYGMEITADGMEPIAFGDIMDEVFGLLNAYIAAVPTAKQIAGECENITFYYAEQPKPEFIVQAFDDLAANNWENVDNGRLSGEIVRSRSIAAYNNNLRAMIGQALGINLPAININDVANYRFNESTDDPYNVIVEFIAQASQYTGTNRADLPLVDRYLTACPEDVYLQNAGSNAGTVFAADIEKEISIAIYVAIEEAVVNSVDTMEITLDGLMGIAGEGNAIFEALGDMPEALSNNPGPRTIKTELVKWFTGSDTGRAMCKVYGLFKIGDGMSVHPTPSAHDKLFEVIKTAYETGYTAKDETVKNALELLSALSNFVAEYYDDAYEYGYGYADENGYIDAAVSAIDEAIAAIEALEIEDGVMSAELKAALEAELAEVVKTLTEIKAALTNDKAATVEGLLETIFALEDDLYAHLANVETILTQAGVDAYEYLYPIVMEQIEIIKTEVIPAILEAVEMAAEKAYNYLVVKVGEIMGIMLDLKATVEENLEILREQLAEIYGIIIDVNTTVEEIIAAIRNHIAKITMGEYTVSDDSYYVAIDGEGYADILADALNLTPDQFNAVALDEVTFEEIAKADFITVGYDDSSVVAFTTEQFLGYAKAYLDGTLRTDVESYIDDALSAIFATDVMAEIKDGVNSAIDSVVASEMLADKEVVALDWAALVGAENVARIDEIRADIKASLVNAGVPAVAEIEINVVETLYEYGFNAFTKEFLYNNLGENAYYTVEIPVLDLAVFTAESALYEKVRYNANYSETILAINKINPDATVAVLGNYDIFDGVSLGIDKITGETTIPVTELLGLEEIPGIIESIVAQLPAGDDLVLELGDLANMEVYEVEIPVAELVAFATEKFTALAGFVETVEVPVTNENLALILDYAKNAFAVEAYYNAFVADVMAKLEKASEVGVYTVEIPVGAIIDYAVDTYDYLVDLFALLADVDYTVDDVTVSVTVDLAGAYETLVELSSIHPLVYAVLFENVFFVDVSDVETNFEAIVADGDILTYILCCIDNIDIVAPSAAGNEYIAEQILKALVVTCDHVYDDCADVDCNRCGELREAPGHIGGAWMFDEENHWKECSVCGAKVDEAAHTSATDCDVCGYHVHANGVKQNGQAATCTVDGWNDYYACSCGKFFADAACTEEIADLEAWKVGAGKIVAAHNYGDLVPAVDEKHTATELVAGVAAHYQCSVCETYFTADKVETTLAALTGATPSHVFGSWVTDEEKHWKECSCGLKTEEGAHVDADNDDKCDTCAKALATGPDSGTTLPAHTHSFGDWVTDDQNHWKVCSCGEKSELGEHKDADNDGKCDVCKADMTSEDSEEGLSTGATVAIVVGSSVVVAIGGFSLVWFVFCKKSWLDLVAIFKR